ncbi:MAG TPA: efflux RND transporter periplasmic adaptor subunit, partial [Steroidobacteraceae bacterium]|nr:efflux RND transporter periplasmic adaptor subunit [Steroidobacteraceae bacterium]
MRILHSFFIATLVASVTCAARPAAAQTRAGSSSLAVSVTTPRTEQFARTVVATGSVYAWQEAVIGSEVGGYRVAAVNVDIGDKVRKGQELVRLASDLLAAEVAAKRAAKAQADAQLITATSNLRRAESILNSGAVSDAQHEQLKAEFLAAQARVAAAESDLEGSQLKLQYTRVLAPDDGVITARTV